MFTRLAKTLCFLSVAIALTMPSVAKADILIDDFSAGSNLFQLNAGSTGQTTIDSSILGGSRVDSLTVSNTAGAFFGAMGFGNSLQLAQGANDQISGSLLYDNFGSIDITQGGTNFAFQLQLIASDSVAAMANIFSITLTSGVVSSTTSFGVPGNGSVPANILVNFSDFGFFDLTNVDSIQLNFNFATAPGNDLAIGSFSAVPEPVSATSCLLVLTLIGLRRRRLDC